MSAKSKTSNIKDGEINSDGSINFAANTEFLNQNSINAADDITISAPIFTNGIGGNDIARTWKVIDEGLDTLIKTEVWSHAAGISQNPPALLPGPEATIANNPYKDYWIKMPNVDAFSSTANDMERREYYKSVKVEEEEFQGTAPDPNALTPQLIAGKILTIKNFNKGVNAGAGGISGATAAGTIGGVSGATEALAA